MPSQAIRLSQKVNSTKKKLIIILSPFHLIKRKCGLGISGTIAGASVLVKRFRSFVFRRPTEGSRRSSAELYLAIAYLMSSRKFSVRDVKSAALVTPNGNGSRTSKLQVAACRLLNFVQSLFHPGASPSDLTNCRLQVSRSNFQQTVIYKRRH